MRKIPKDSTIQLSDIETITYTSLPTNYQRTRYRQAKCDYCKQTLPRDSITKILYFRERVSNRIEYHYLHYSCLKKWKEVLGSKPFWEYDPLLLSWATALIPPSNRLDSPIHQGEINGKETTKKEESKSEIQ